MKHNDLFFNDEGGSLLHLDGLESDFTKHFNHFGTGFIMASNHGVDMAVYCENMSPSELSNDSCLWWPEVGVKLDTEALKAVYARQKTSIGRVSLECDFMTKSKGLSLMFFPDARGVDVFGMVTETYVSSPGFVNSSTQDRDAGIPSFDTCACCKKRAERTRQDVESHPICRIFRNLMLDELPLEFHLHSVYVDMLNLWTIREFDSQMGIVTVADGSNFLRLDVSMVHSMQLVHIHKGGEMHSVLRCYNSLGGIMVEFSVSGGEPLEAWHRLCSVENYGQV